MKKIIIVVFGLISIPLIGSLEPLSATDKQKLNKIKKEREQIVSEMDAEYKLQADVFRTSAQKGISPVNYLPQQRNRLKEIVDDLIIVTENSGNERLKEFASKLRVFTLKAFNAAEAINNNIEDALGDAPRRDAARELITESIDKLSSFSLDFKNIAINTDQYNTGKNPYREHALALRDYAITMQKICDMARSSAQNLMRATKPQPKKSKNVFKRIFGS